MSSIDNLFGKVGSEKVEATVNDIFSQKSNAVDAVSIKTKLRTILPSIKQKRKSKESGEKAEESEEKAEEPVQKKHKKTKAGEGEDDLEGRYFAKILDDKDTDKKAVSYTHLTLPTN